MCEQLTNSTPMTPAPIRINFSGTLLSERAPVEDMTTCSSNCEKIITTSWCQDHFVSATGTKHALYNELNINTHNEWCYLMICWRTDVSWHHHEQMFISHKYITRCSAPLNISKVTSKCGKKISSILCYTFCATFSFSPHFDIICDLSLNRGTATWDLLVNLTKD